MPEWFDNINDLPVIVSLLVAFFGALLWVINMKVSAIKHELQPNSGKSVADAIHRIETKLDAHISWHITHRENE